MEINPLRDRKEHTNAIALRSRKTLEKPKTPTHGEEKVPKDVDEPMEEEEPNEPIEEIVELVSDPVNTKSSTTKVPFSTQSEDKKKRDENIGLGDLTNISIMLQLAYRSLVHPKGVLEDVLVKFVQAYLSDLDRVNSKIPGQRIEEERWRPRDLFAVKINFKATFDKETNKSSTCIVCRDSEGVILGSKTVVNIRIPTPFAAEVVIEGDTLSVIEKVQSKEEDRSLISPYINDIKFLSKRFGRCYFKKTSRNDNGVVHGVANEGLKRNESTYLGGSSTGGGEGTRLDSWALGASSSLLKKSTSDSKSTFERKA
ncbi:hypothetical protein Goklo_006533, partial [Gossypium klotzschianum]|nr:hypothetical protein [Gossypium klotzschianum]